MVELDFVEVGDNIFGVLFLFLFGFLKFNFFSRFILFGWGVEGVFILVMNFLFVDFFVLFCVDVVDFGEGFGGGVRGFGRGVILEFNKFFRFVIGLFVLGFSDKRFVIFLFWGCLGVLGIFERNEKFEVDSLKFFVLILGVDVEVEGCWEGWWERWLKNCEMVDGVGVVVCLVRGRGWVLVIGVWCIDGGGDVEWEGIEIEVVWEVGMEGDFVFDDGRDWVVLLVVVGVIGLIFNMLFLEVVSCFLDVGFFF